MQLVEAHDRAVQLQLASNLRSGFAVSAYSHLIRSQAKCKEVIDQLCKLSERLRGSLSWTFKLVRGTVVVRCCRQLLRSQTAISRKSYRSQSIIFWQANGAPLHD